MGRVFHYLWLKVVSVELESIGGGNERLKSWDLT